MLQAKHDNVSHYIVEAVPYKHHTDSKSHIDEHVRKKQNANAEFNNTWSEVIAMSAQYHADKKLLIAMLSQFQSMRHGHLGGIKIANHRIELLQPDTAPGHSTLYRAGPKTKEFEEAEVDKMLVESVIEPAQAEWAVPIVLVPKRNGNVRFRIDYCKLNTITKRDSYLTRV